MLHLQRVNLDAALSDAVVRVPLIDDREAQEPFVVPKMIANGDELIARLLKRLEAALPRPTDDSGLGQRVRDVAADAVKASSQGDGA